MSSASPGTGAAEASYRRTGQAFGNGAQLSGVWVGLISVTFFFLVWQLTAVLQLADDQLISSPLQVLAATIRLIVTGELLVNIWISMLEFFLGMFVALALGVLLGLAMGWYQRLGMLFDPLIMTFYTMPRDALLPVIVIWLGIGLSSKAAVVFLGAVFPIIVNTVTGIREADPSWIRVAKAYGAKEREIFWKILLPGCLPYLMAGVRLGIGRAVIGVIIAEMYVSNLGLGALVMKAQIGLDTDTLIATVLLTALLGFLAVKAARSLENHIGRWREEAQ